MPAKVPFKFRFNATAAGDAPPPAADAGDYSVTLQYSAPCVLPWVWNMPRPHEHSQMNPHDLPLHAGAAGAPQYQVLGSTRIVVCVTLLANRVWGVQWGQSPNINHCINNILNAFQATLLSLL